MGLWRYNADGIDMVSSQDVTIADCFVRAFDDNIVLKGGRNRQQQAPGMNVKNIEVRNCVLWNDWGRALEIGAETVADSICDIRFIDNDIIHFVHMAMSIQNGDRAKVSRILYKDIRVEQPIKELARIADYTYQPEEIGRLIDLNVRDNRYSRDTMRGKIENITFRNITYTGTFFPVTSMQGLGVDHDVSNILFENIVINGERVRNTEDLKLQRSTPVGGDGSVGTEDLKLQDSDFVSNITVK
ncbi:MAG: hypothetical protein EHM46_05420 [Bacteroidetes bacterium]|nr:MAG: hypothetical protein EHM46_05420 [Bacteroidota bacterium]